jgi:site-specific DNA recombinase
MARPVSVSMAKLHPASALVGAEETPLLGEGVPIRCVIYAAKSTEDKRGSIRDQLEECRAVIEVDIDRRVVGEHTDEAFSAFTGNRGPGLVEAIRQVEELASGRGAVELWAQHSDRLARGDGRSARHAVEIALWALKRDVRVRTVQDPDTFRDLLYAVVTGQRNHEDSRRKGLAVAAGRRRAAVRGDHLGYRPDGYRLAVEIDEREEVVKRLVVDPERQPAIELVFRMARRGESGSTIARALNDAGWLTKPLFRNKRPVPWTAERISALLRNPRYAGLSLVNGEVVARGHWPAYITPREYAALRARLSARSSARSPRRSEPYLLSRLASCRSCGGPLFAHTRHQRTDGTFYRRYSCASSRNASDVGRCLAQPVSADMIEAMFVAGLPSLMKDGDHRETNEDDSERNGRPTISVTERQRVIDDVFSADDRRLDATLASLIERRAPELVMLRRRAGSNDDDALRAFQIWAEDERLGRTDATREQTRTLNGVLRARFASVAIAMDETGVTIDTVQRSPAGEPLPQTHATVHFDLQAWTRASPDAVWRRRRFGRWSDPEILGALQAWTDTRGSSPTEQDWATAAREHPRTRTVLSHFASWDQALAQAGLTPA